MVPFPEHHIDHLLMLWVIFKPPRFSSYAEKAPAEKLKPLWGLVAKMFFA